MSGDRGGGPDAARRATAARFFRAAEQGDLATLRALAAERPALVTLERAADDERTALHYAVLNRDAACARFLLSAGADPRKGVFPHRDATAPLTLADERGYDDIAGLIRSELAQRAARAGAASPHAGPDGADPAGGELFDLVRGGDLDGVRRLLDAAPERVAEVDAQGLTPLDCAALSFGWTQRDRAPAARAAAQALVDAGAELTPRGAAALGDLSYLRSASAEQLQAVTTDAGGVLTLAVKFGQPEALRLLLAKGLDPDERVPVANLDAPPHSWGMPLWHAAAGGEYGMAEALLDAGADVNALVYASGSAMERAYGARDERMKALLRRRGAVVTVETIGLYRDTAAARAVAAGAMPAVTDRTDRTPFEQLLWAAACGGEPAIMALCLPRVERPRGDPWWCGVLRQPMRIWNHAPNNAGGGGFDRSTYPRCLQLLLEHGVDPDVTDHHGATALHHVAQAGATWGRQVITEQERAAFAALLLDAGADLTRRDPLLRSTPLGWACRWGRYDLARLLIDRGAAAGEPDAEPWAAPLSWAVKKGHAGLAALLRRAGA